MSFQGSPHHLKARVSLWPASGELQVEGHPQASRALEARLEQAITGQGG
jgi:hypothetical protein